MGERPPLVVRLDGRTDRSTLGGKAAALDRLVELGHPVPRSVVVTADAGREVARLDPIRELLDRAGGAADGEIDEAFTEVVLPRRVGDALALVPSLVTGRVAVRSSATCEDLAATAFAGQYRTVLDVDADDPAAVEHAVRLVWASLWHEAPRRYREILGVDDRDPAMAVLVMEMVDASTAGVLFTRDPIGDDGDLRLETVQGAGDQLVSGAVTPRSFAWRRGGAATHATAELGAVFGELVERSLAIEAVLGVPQDIEFAVDADECLHIVQARPITTRPTGRFTRSGIAEMLPGVLPPLMRSTAAAHVEEGFRDLITLLDGDPGDDEPYLRSQHGRAMLDIDRLGRATATVPGGSVAELERGGRPLAGTPGGDRPSTLRTLRILRHRRASVLEAAIVTRAVDRLVERDTPLDRLDDDELLARWERVVDLGARVTAAEMAVAAMATAAYSGVERALGRHVDDPAVLARHLTRRSRRTGPLARCTRDLPAVPAADFAERWEAALARSGSRSVFGGPTWADEPELAWLSLTATAGAGTGEDDRRRGLRDELRPIRTLSPVRRRFVVREAADAAALLDRRETTKQALLDLGGIAHRLTVEIGHRLADRGTVPHADDVWLLDASQVGPALLERAAPGDLAGRRAAHAADLARAVPIGSAGDGEGWGVSPGTATGRARVVDAPRAGAIRPGEVLVAAHTDAGWSPLFAIAGAVVVEEGGPLSHAAILARELGVPAVVNVAGIVRRVREAGAGAEITVDGSAGTVDVRSRPNGPRVVADPSPVPVLAPPDDTQAVAVFVTGLIGASALLGTVMSITEAVSSRRGRRRLRRRAEAPGRITADVVLRGTEAARRAVAGLRAARWYGGLAAMALVLAVALGGSGVGEYVTSEPGPSVFGLAASLTATASLVGVATVVAAAWRHWPDVPPVVRRLTPPARRRNPVREFLASMPEPHRRWLAVASATWMLLLGATLTVEPTLRRADRWLYDRIGAPDTDAWGPGWFGMYFGRPQVAIPVALLIALFTVRCRVLAIAYPATIAFGGLLNLGLGSLVGRGRPPLGAHADQTDSFPSGHAIEVTLLFGLLPLAVAVLLRSRRAGAVARLLATPVLIVMLVDGLREGSHWPSDHLAGVAIAMTAVIVVHALARVDRLHETCDRCPALALRRGPP